LRPRMLAPEPPNSFQETRSGMACEEGFLGRLRLLAAATSASARSFT